MDAQSRVAETASLAALVQSLARLELEGEPMRCRVGPEVLGENRFLAARDGVEARLVDPVQGTLVPLRATVTRYSRECRRTRSARLCRGAGRGAAAGVRQRCRPAA